ncbi:LppX_LprAFG lipoprotein [Pseudonocardia lacus]|uniref:LppX_LprAFG lipoprotein n=1 Tax=Pseudonocardia lacus TaxID=2835865 RepID=UPI001BDDC976|nr:LppX_LprAFG lipoprotein [Pseudonocardia lacus]
MSPSAGLPARSASPRRWVRRAAAVALAALAVLPAACSGGPEEPALPNAIELLSRGADAMRTVTSAAVDIAIDPTVTSVPIRSANGTITADGQAEGTAVLTLGGGAPLEYQLVVTGDVLYLKGPTGGYSPLPLASAAAIYDPTAILDPERGTAALLAGADQGTTQAREVTEGVDSFKVAATFPAERVATLVPGVTEAVPGVVWLDAVTSRLVRAELELPDGPAGAGGPVSVRMSEYDAPVSITPPA